MATWKVGDTGKAVFAKAVAGHALDPILVHRTRTESALRDRVVLAVQEEPVAALASASARLLARERGRQKVLILNGSMVPQWVPGRWLLTLEEARRLWPNATAPRNG